MAFENWLIEIGKSHRTAGSYSRAVFGVISDWTKAAGLSAVGLENIQSVKQLLAIAADLEQVDIYVDRNQHGNNMYSCALKAYIEYRRREMPEELEQDVDDIIADAEISETEKATYISARVGQGKYRHDLIGYWERCAVTRFADVRLLVASHIKPWRKSDNRERLDTYNGLLLLPNLDKVFDLGFITFAEEGKIIVSDHLEEADKLGVNHEMHIRLEKRHQGYMRFHREGVFERNI